MNQVWLVFFFLGCIGPFSLVAVSPGTVNVGAIFTFGSINGRVARIAMKAAEDDINSDPSILGGRKLSITMHDSNFSGFLGIIGGMISSSECFLSHILPLFFFSILNA